MNKKNCKGCGTDISHRDSRTQWCSKKCRSAHPVFMGTHCKHCKKELLIAHDNKNNKSFCDMYCRMYYNNPSFRANFFKEPDLINSYWAGFIAADGCITNPKRGQSKLSIQLKAEDFSHLESFKTTLGAGTLKEYTRFDKRTERHYFSAQYRVSSDEICQDLAASFNIHPRKSLTHKPPLLHGECAYAFIAGYIDGDGCYYKGQWSTPILTVEGTYEMLSWLTATCGVDKSPTPRGKIYHLALYADNALSVYEKYAHLEIPLLERKKNFWQKSGARTEKRG